MLHPTHVIAIGEALIDITPDEDGVQHEYPGGSPANVALALGRMGKNVTLATQFADDARGEAISAWLEASHVDVAKTSPSTGRTSTAKVSWDEDRNADYEFDLAWDLSEEDLAALPAADVVHFGSIASVLEPGARSVAQFVAQHADRALVSFDPNARPGITPDRASVVGQVEELVALTDVVKVSDEDLRWYYPNDDAVDVVRRWLSGADAEGPIVIALTQGGDGVHVFRGSEDVFVPAPKVTMVDTIAAGDTFTAALIDALIDAGASGAGARATLASMELTELARAAAWAATAAAITVSRPGADPPSRDEILAAQAASEG